MTTSPDAPTDSHYTAGESRTDNSPAPGRTQAPTRASGLPLGAKHELAVDLASPEPTQQHSPADCTSLADVRAEIDRLDRAVVKLLVERGRYVLAAARFKRNVAKVHAPARVEQVIMQVRRLAEQAGGMPDVVECGYRAMIAAYTEAEEAERGRL